MTEYLMDAADKIGWLISRGSRGFYLVGTVGEEIQTWDGPHDRVSDVAKALELYRRLGFASRYERFVMVEICDIPEPSKPVELNEEAIEACKEMLNRA
jgi:hypothetical protein